MVGAAGVPIGQRELVAGADDAHLQVVAHVLEPELVSGNARVKARDVGVARRRIVLLNRVIAPAPAQPVGVVARATDQGVGTRLAVQYLVTLQF